MLPNHPPCLHRRQNSTPSAFQGVKKPSVPAAARARQSRAAAHRRGLSLDTRQKSLGVALSTARQGNMHALLRETQQHSTSARPGSEQRRHHQHQEHFSSPHTVNSDGENYLTPHGTPRSQSFDLSPFDFDVAQPALGNFGHANLSATFFGPSFEEYADFDLFVDHSAGSSPSYANFQESPASQGYSSEGGVPSPRNASRRVSNGIRDRVIKFEGYAMDSQRPMTPPEQNTTTNFPPTPSQTPQEQHKQDSQHAAETQAEDWSDETIKPKRNRSPQDAQNTFQQLRLQAEQQSAIITTPPASSSSPITMPYNTPHGLTSSYMPDDNLINGNIMPGQNDFGCPDRVPGLNGNYYMPGGFMMSGGMNMAPGNFAMQPNAFGMAPGLSQPQSPTTYPVGGYAYGFNNQMSMSPLGMRSVAMSPVGTPPARLSATPSSRRSNHRRGSSVMSATTSSSVASMADLSLDGTKHDTGISAEEISLHISGPDQADGKWCCTYDGCNKRFGRKENIKSHVQTHLNDRQFMCSFCHKCFVRQHDLKRHAKIHSGDKPFPCKCGNSFARQDALTRHRQRGMCIGGIEGKPRVAAKRGRPRKERPAIDERQLKSARQRRQNNMSISSTSSNMSTNSGFSYMGSQTPAQTPEQIPEQIPERQPEQQQQQQQEENQDQDLFQAFINTSNTDFLADPFASGSVIQDEDLDKMLFDQSEHDLFPPN